MDMRAYGYINKLLGVVILDFIVVSTPSVDHVDVVMGAPKKQLQMIVEKLFVLNAR